MARSLTAVLLLTLCAHSHSACVNKFEPVSAALEQLDLQPPVAWQELQGQCSAQFPGYDLLYRWQQLTDEERTLCAGQLVPLGKEKLHENPPSNNTAHYAINLTSNAILNVSEQQVYACAVCQMYPRKEILKQFYPQPSVFTQNIQVTVTTHVTPPDLASAAALVDTIMRDLSDCTYKPVDQMQWHRTDKYALNVTQVNIRFPSAVDATYFKKLTANMTNSNYSVTDVTFLLGCPDLNSTDDQPHSYDGYTQIGEVLLWVNEDLTLTTRECAWNYDADVEASEWHAPVTWDLLVAPCRDEAAHDAAYSFKIRLIVLLKALRAGLLRTTQGQLSEVTAMLAGRSRGESGLHGSFQNTVNFIVQSGAMEVLEALESNVTLSSDVLTRSAYRFYLLIGDLTVVTPITGFAFSVSKQKVPTIHPVSDYDEYIATQDVKVLVTVSEAQIESSERVAFALFVNPYLFGDYSIQFPIGTVIYMVQVLLVSSDGTQVSDSDAYVDLVINKDNLFSQEHKTQCAVWSFEDSIWSPSGCYKLRSSRGSMAACRCKHIQLRGYINVYLSNPSFQDYLDDKPGLLALIIISCVLSAVGVTSIVLTALSNKKWRGDLGHQILLHMLTALTLNLILGFYSNFESFDTQSDYCVVVGVFRHYSFLAMFAWMLVLSGLQAKRLMTIAGANSDHLLLKVAIFAWGIPLLPIAVLLSWSTKFYRSAVDNRGYCYPEGTAFQLAVQAPAGIILVTNAFIFTAIVKHIFECCAVTKIQRHGISENVIQLRRLGTSVFIFFLFGFAWIFHFLAEEKVIQSEFLFDYLFLITATTHVFVLAVFFVFFDEQAMGKWKELLCCRR